jgi:hypothetical protein
MQRVGVAGSACCLMTREEHTALQVTDVYRHGMYTAESYTFICRIIQRHSRPLLMPSFGKRMQFAAPVWQQKRAGHKNYNASQCLGAVFRYFITSSVHTRRHAPAHDRILPQSVQRQCLGMHHAALCPQGQLFMPQAVKDLTTKALARSGRTVDGKGYVAQALLPC